MSDGAPALEHRAGHASAQIELAGLVKSFDGPDGPIRAVAGIDVAIAAGETVALLGPNGEVQLGQQPPIA